MSEATVRIFTLCKKLTDPPNETKGAWRRAYCCVCGVPLRATDKARDAAAVLQVPFHALCFDCSVQGPDFVFDNFGKWLKDLDQGFATCMNCRTGYRVTEGAGYCEGCGRLYDHGFASCKNL